MTACSRPDHPDRASVQSLRASLPFLFSVALLIGLWARSVSAQEPEGVQGVRYVAFPSEDLFSPLIADMKQPRFSAGLRSMRLTGTAFPSSYGSSPVTAGLTGAGGSFPFWGVRHGADGMQIGITGGAYSLFNLSLGTADLINTDFVAAVPITARRGPWSGRLRVMHQSSHLGDQLLVHNPGFERQNMSFEAVDLLLALDGRALGVGWRAYAGSGALIHTKLPMKPWSAQSGLELRGRTWSSVFDTRLSLVAAGDLAWMQERGANITPSVKAGVESQGVGTNRLRVLAAWLYGYTPFGQFATRERVRELGLELQMEL